MLIKNWEINVIIKDLPQVPRVWQNLFKHKHHSCYIAANWMCWLYNSWQENDITKMLDMEQRMVDKRWIPRAPLSWEAWAKKICEVTPEWEYIFFKHFSAEFFNFLNEGYMITVPMHSTQWWMDDWKAWKIITWWHGKIRWWHLCTMKKIWDRYAQGNTQFNEPNPIRWMEKLRVQRPFYLEENEMVYNRCTLIRPKKN